MSANIYCWEPSLALEPSAEDFLDKIHELHSTPYPPPSETMVKLVDALLQRYPDLTVTEDTVWADGPLTGNIIGRFINIGIIWSRYEEAALFVISTAQSMGLHCYDPQGSNYFSAP
jgi:hypothetical protein